MSELVRPTGRYQTSYLAALVEFHAEDRYTQHKIEELRGDFDAHVRRERQQIHGDNIPAYRVPETVFWLIDADSYIGRLELRHTLNDYLFEVGGHIGYSIRPSRRRRGYGTQILRLGLARADRRGMDRVLLTCDPENIASRKIIEQNGGVFENRVDVMRDHLHYHKLRFWIDVAAQLGQPPRLPPERPRR